MSCWLNWPVLDFGTPWVIAKIIVTFPVLRWSYRSRNESATTVGADVAQHVVYARGTERTFVAADTRIKCVRQQWLIAMFAVRSEFKHCALSVMAISPELNLPNYVSFWTVSRIGQIMKNIDRFLLAFLGAILNQVVGSFRRENSQGDVAIGKRLYSRAICLSCYFS